MTPTPTPEVPAALRGTPLDVRVSIRDDGFAPDPVIALTATLRIQAECKVAAEVLAVNPDEVSRAVLGRLGEEAREQYEELTGRAELIAEVARLREVIATARRECASWPKRRVDLFAEGLDDILAESGVER